MGTREVVSPLASALFGKVRRAVLALLYGHPDRAFFLREVARAVGAGQGAVQRELARLTRAAIVQRRQHGRQVYYQANPACPVFPELRSLVTKTVGLVDVLRDALDPLRDRIKVAFVYGSAARGELGSESDVDLMVVGDVGFGEIADLLSPTQDRIGREVNPAVFPVGEYRQRVAEDSDFVAKVSAAERILVIGDERDVGELAG